MSIFICNYCGCERKSKKSLIGHETFCKSNPNHKIQNTETARAIGRTKVKCTWCSKKYTKNKKKFA
jgi:redox-regulated HSP33 family molecular chaperone